MLRSMVLTPEAEFLPGAPIPQRQVAPPPLSRQHLDISALRVCFPILPSLQII